MRNCHRDRRTWNANWYLVFFQPQPYPFFSSVLQFPPSPATLYVITASLRTVQIPRIYPVFLPSSLHRHRTPPHTTKPVLPPGPSTTKPIYQCEWMCQHVQGFKKKKKRNLANFEEEWWKKNEESVEQNAIVRIDFKENNRENVHTHTFVGLCRDILHQLCKTRDRGRKCACVWEKRGD